MNAARARPPINIPKEPITVLFAFQGSGGEEKRRPSTSARPSPPHINIRAMIPVGESFQ
jgi:hypothetical protein